MVNAIQHRARTIRFRNAAMVHGFVMFWLMACLCFAPFNQAILPAKYFFDAANIASRFGYVDGFVRGESFDNTALFYRLLLLSGSWQVSALVTAGVFSVFVFQTMKLPERFDRAVLHDLLIFTFTCIVGSVYLAQYSKEAIVMLIAMYFFGVSGKGGAKVIWVLVACVYAAYFREYWFLVVAFYIYYTIVLRWARSMSAVLLGIVIAFLILAVAFQGIFGVGLSHYRDIVNDARTYDLDANTMIKPLLPTGGIALGWLNAVLQFILMFFPFPLLSGNPLYLFFFVVISSLAIRLYRITRSIVVSRGVKRGGRQFNCLALVLSFVTIQSVFEPDYGSYIKHLTPMLPLVQYVLYMRKWTQRSESESLHLRAG
ncbi:hypothetical protein [Paraburkholderia sediminicola]|uniref:hypothetical protein n=1 Tax=Paraburkholderia sediminicola TaxID=458836 RepID=UPI0038BA7F9A